MVRTHSYAAERITSGEGELALMVGVDTQVFHGFVNCGAVGAITGVGNALPKPTLRLIELCQEAIRGNSESLRLAKELDSALAVLSKFDEGPDLVLYYKELMVLEGFPAYTRQLNPSDQLSSSQLAFLRTLSGECSRIGGRIGRELRHEDFQNQGLAGRFATSRGRLQVVGR